MLYSSGDSELFARVREGDHDAFNQLFLKFYKPLLLFANFIVEEDEAKDLIADLFLELWEKRTRLGIHSSVSAYLHTALKNKAINRKKRIERNIYLDESQLNNIRDTAFAAPDRLLMTKEFNEQIEFHIGRLPERCRMIFLLNRDNKLSYQEIAQLLDISLNTVKTQMFRALRFLRHSLFLNETSSRAPGNS